MCDEEEIFLSLFAKLIDDEQTQEKHENQHRKERRILSWRREKKMTSASTIIKSFFAHLKASWYEKEMESIKNSGNLHELQRVEQWCYKMVIQNNNKKIIMSLFCCEGDE